MSLDQRAGGDISGILGQGLGVILLGGGVGRDGDGALGDFQCAVLQGDGVVSGNVVATGVGDLDGVFLDGVLGSAHLGLAADDLNGGNIMAAQQGILADRVGILRQCLAVVFFGGGIDRDGDGALGYGDLAGVGGDIEVCGNISAALRELVGSNGGFPFAGVGAATAVGDFKAYAFGQLAGDDLIIGSAVGRAVIFGRRGLGGDGQRNAVGIGKGVDGEGAKKLVGDGVVFDDVLAVRVLDGDDIGSVVGGAGDGLGAGDSDGRLVSFKESFHRIVVLAVLGQRGAGVIGGSAVGGEGQGPWVHPQHALF